MSNKQILATYTNGTFRPVDPDSLGLIDGQNVTLSVEPIDRATYILSLARQVYEGLSEEEIEAVEQEIRGSVSISVEIEIVGSPEIAADTAAFPMHVARVRCG